MAKNVLIVESPAKAKTIEQFLGKDFRVASCYGHVSDLVKKGMGVDLETFTPTYEVSADKRSVIAQLSKLTQKAETVWLASDEDREGEAIAWHLYNELELDKKETKRIVFNEITKTAITEAIKTPRSIDQNLVNAQQARRILDRIVGFELSPLLWKKIRMGLSAGRVQSVAVRIIVERERLIEQFISTFKFRTKVLFQAEGNSQSLPAELNHRFDTEDAAREFVDRCMQSSFEVRSVTKRAFKQKPVAPFTTSTLQQEASRRLGYSLSRTMTLAQRLYEAGYITYMRTDSTSLSKQAQQAIHREIATSFGDKYLQARTFKTKTKNSQEAHEAIRPTNFKKLQVKDPGQQKIYDLIWKRTVASQMSDAELEKTRIEIQPSKSEYFFISEGDTLIFDGFLKLYRHIEEEELGDSTSDGLLIPVRKGQPLTMESLLSKQAFTRPKPRYTEASLVRNLEELGIGRPSTYAPTISTIQKREYVLKGDIPPKQRLVVELKVEKGKLKRNELEEAYGADKGKMIPSDVGKLVNDFLVEHFEKVMDYHFTAGVEDIFDSIAKGKKDWKKELQSFYQEFHPKIEKVGTTAERVSGERELGLHPKTSQKITARVARFGPVVQMESEDPDEKPLYASILKPYTLDTITLDQALMLFKLPRDVGEYEGKKIVAAVGRFGPYLRHDQKFFSIRDADGDSPYLIQQGRAVEVIEIKRKEDREKFISAFDYQDQKVEILNGRWGPYIKFGGKNYKIPKDVDAKKMGLEDCVRMIENPAPSKRPVRKTTRKKK